MGSARRPNSNSGSIDLSWKADDPNGDQLVYSVFYKADDEETWKLIDDEIKNNRLPLNVRQVGDGRYRFRVLARDEFSNAPGEGLSGEMISDEVVIDNTPPEILNFKVADADGRARVRADISDSLSLISSIEIDFDGGDAYPIFTEDGFLDEREETIDWASPALEAGEHVLTLAVTDRAGNTTVARKVFSIR